MNQAVVQKKTLHLNTNKFSKIYDIWQVIPANMDGKAEILARLQREILPLQGYKPFAGSINSLISLGEMNNAFPGGQFPQGAVHEFCCLKNGNEGATNGFIAGILGSLMKKSGVVIWMNSDKRIFPHGLAVYGIEPSRVIFLNLQNEKEKLWAIEEALKCEGLTAVVADIKNPAFVTTRRWQLAVEQSGVTGFVIRNDVQSLQHSACLARWNISSVESWKEKEFPGIGFPGWNVQLLKIRNGKTGSWRLHWINQHFVMGNKHVSLESGLHRKTG